MLACRRSPRFILDVGEDTYRETLKMLDEKFGRSLQGIFSHYASRADIRRKASIASKTSRRGKDGLEPLDSPSSPTDSGKMQMSDLKSLRDMIGYEEYTQFCQDYNLKSTALLTAIQVGDVFLTVVPMDPELKAIKGMNFQSFCKSLISMALIAFRDIKVEVSCADKVSGDIFGLISSCE